MLRAISCGVLVGRPASSFVCTEQIRYQRSCAGSGAIDHFALSAHGFGETRERCRALKILIVSGPCLVFTRLSKSVAGSRSIRTPS